MENAKGKSRWTCQIGLRTLFALIAIFGAMFAYGSHFRRLTLQAQTHHDEAQQRSDWLAQMVRVSFHVPQQYWTANEADLKWHSAKEKECLQARWFPWRAVDESSIPPLAGDNEAWPKWSTNWRRARK